MVVVKDSFKMLEKKKQVLDMIRDFVRVRPFNPKYRYDHIKAYIEKLEDNKEISPIQNSFLLRVLEVEYGMALVQQGEDERRLRDDYYGG